MNLETINTISQIILVVHTVLLYPIFKFAYSIEKRLTILEVTEDTKAKLKTKI